MTYTILNSRQGESDEFCWGDRATKAVLKVNPQKSTEHW